MSEPHVRPASSRYRWLVCGLLFWVTTANYIDRGVFGNLAPELQKRIGWTAGQYWYLQVAFFAAYALSYAVGGRLMDVLGLRRGFAIAVAFWGFAAMAHGLVGSVAGFFVVRILLGLGEGGNFPAAIKTTAEWFPQRERALATGIFNSGSNFGNFIVPVALAFLIPVFAKIRIAGHVVGWRGAFFTTGLFDLLWIGAWLACYRPPAEHEKVSAEELALIQQGHGQSAETVPWSRLIRHRQTWAIAIAKFMTDCMSWFYLVGTPSFLADRFHMGLASRGAPLACIYILASVGSIGGGWLSGRFMKWGWSVNKSRKITLLICAIAVLPVFYAGLTHNYFVAVGLITIAAAAHQAWAVIVFSLVPDMFPRKVVGSVTGLVGMAGAVGAILLFAIFGMIRDGAVARGDVGDYLPIFATASIAYVTALLILHLLVPRLKGVNP